MIPSRFLNTARMACAPVELIPLHAWRTEVVNTAGSSLFSCLDLPRVSIYVIVVGCSKVVGSVVHWSLRRAHNSAVSFKQAV